MLLPRFLTHPLYPSLCLSVGLLVAILAQLFAAWLPSTSLMLLLFTLSFVSFLWGRFFLCGLCLGVLAVGLNAPIPYQHDFNDCYFRAQIARPNYSSRSLGQSVYLFAEEIRCGEEKKTLPPQRLQYWDNQHTLDDLLGQRLTATAKLIPVRARLNPYHFDYEKYLLSKGIRLSAKQLTIVATEPESSVLLKMKQYLADTLQAKLSSQSAGIILALLSGNRTALSATQKATMQATGTSHLLAISGLHLALVGGIFWLLTQWLWGMSWTLSDRLSPRHAGAIIALIAITFYAVFTGFDVPVKRAWIMFSLLILSWLSGRGVANSSLLLAASAVMFVSPYAVVSVGFYFSFLATFIVLWSSRLPYSPLLQVLIMQILINLTLLPITWSAFGIISLSALFVNILVIPWLGLWVLPWAILAALLSTLSDALATPVWQLLDITTTMLWQTISFAEQRNWTFQPETRPPLLAVIIAVMAIIGALISGIRWLFIGVLLIFLPPYSTVSPAIIVADKRYASALFHNGKTAILVNAGRRYRHINEAQIWQQYLQQHRLTLGAIILENSKLMRISATKWLLEQFPTAKVITLEAFPLPYSAQFCQSVVFEQLSLKAQKTDKGCHARIIWFTDEIMLFSGKQAASNALQTQSRLVWRGKIYDSQQLGAITLENNGNYIDIDAMRYHKRLWRGR